jgi:DNA adenine methylase
MAPFVVDLMRENGLFYGGYAEPFAGGCGIAWKLLLNGYASEVHINDIDPSIYSFWAAVLRQTEALCELIDSTPVTIDEWHRQRTIQDERRPGQLRLAFSTFFLNRTNRAGIIRGGVIGGKKQESPYPLDCRYNKVNLIEKIQRIALHRDQICLYREDAAYFLRATLPRLSRQLLVNIDPPFYRKGPELYCSFYRHYDHVQLGKLIGKIRQPWMVTYDDDPAIREIFESFPVYTKELTYSAQVKRVGVELLVLDPKLRLPHGQATRIKQSASAKRTKKTSDNISMNTRRQPA